MVKGYQLSTRILKPSSRNLALISWMAVTPIAAVMIEVRDCIGIVYSFGHNTGWTQAVTMQGFAGERLLTDDHFT